MDFTRFPALLFDLDGTIIDSAPGIIASARYALSHFDREMEDSQLRAFIGPPLEVCFTEVCGLSPEEARQAVGYYRERYGVTGKFECSLYSGVKELLRQLHQSGRKVLLATSKPEQFAVEILEHLGVAEYFTCIAGAAMDHTRQTKEEVIRYLLDRTGLSTTDCLMIGDRKYDVEGAAELSMPCVGVLYGFGSREELETAGAVAILPDAGKLGRLLGLPDEAGIFHPLTRVYLVRHAQPDISVQEDALRPLTEKGLEDRTKTLLLADRGLNALYSSSYRRAMETIEPLAQQTGLPVGTDPDFRERQTGSWIEGNDNFRRFQQEQWADFSAARDGGESLGQVEKRVAAALSRVLAAHPGQRVAVAGHGTAFSVLLHHLDSSFGYEESHLLCKRLPWIVELIFGGEELLSRRELL